MCGSRLYVTIYIEHLYIEFSFSFIFSFFLQILVFLFFYLFFSFYNFVIISWILVIPFCYVLIMWEIWGFLFPSKSLSLWRTLPKIAYKKYYRQKHQDSSTIDVTVKENNSLKLTRSQDSVWLKVALYVAEYDWEYLIEERNCE
jgi:hypothetical protein